CRPPSTYLELSRLSNLSNLFLTSLLKSMAIPSNLEPTKTPPQVLTQRSSSEKQTDFNTKKRETGYR
ncbi:hypothetical protein L9F63_028124, partial [Diploptera punctata]